MRSIKDVIETYQRAAHNKDAELMASLYTDDVYFFEAVDGWSVDGIEEMKKVIHEWFSGLGAEGIRAEISNLKSNSDDKVGFAAFDIKFIRIDTEGESYKSINNRFTIGLINNGEGWKIKHQHASIPTKSQAK